MRCKNCEHLLFNQPAPAEGAPRVCSECGAGYRVADFAFRRGKVQFCCPGCGLAYYGTSSEGHLEPAEFTCVGCGLALDMDRCVLRPFGVASDDEAMLPTLVPWEGRGPWFRRWWRTARLGLTGAEVAVVPSVDARPGRALVFLLVTAGLTAIPGILYTALVWMFGSTLAGGGFPIVAVTPTTIDTLAAWLLGLMTVPVFDLAFVAAIAGCATVSGVPFRRGVVACSYASGARLLLVVPFCGAPLSRVLWTVQACRGIAALAPEGRSVGAVFTALIGAIGVLGAWWFFWMIVGQYL